MRREGAREEIIMKVDNREKSEKSLQILSQKVKSEKYIFSQKILQKFVFGLNMKMLILPSLEERGLLGRSAQVREEVIRGGNVTQLRSRGRFK